MTLLNRPEAGVPLNFFLQICWKLAGEGSEEGGMRNLGLVERFFKTGVVLTFPVGVVKG